LQRRWLLAASATAALFLGAQHPNSANAFTGYDLNAAGAAGISLQASPRGLRNAACRRLAELGCSALQIQEIRGIKT